MPTIRIDDDIFEGLKSLAEPFIDTPNSVIRRMLDERGVLKKLKERANTATSTQRELVRSSSSSNQKNNTTSLTPQPIYETFLLYVLWKKFNGSASKSEATNAVVTLMKSHGFISDLDLELVSTGEQRAVNTTAWSRNALKERGLISKLSPRGIWELTPKGVEEAKQTTLPTADKLS